MAKSELHGADAVDAPDDGATGNITASTAGTKRGIDVSILGDGTISDINGNPVQWTTITVTQTSATIETFTYSNAGGDLVIYTTTYTDATHDVLVSVVKTAP